MNSESHVNENIPAYLAGELNDEERRTVELHLNDCKTCKHELENQKKLDEILSQAQSIEARPELLQGVIQQVRIQQKTVSFSRRILPWLAAAAVIAVVLFLLKIQKDSPAPVEQVKKSPIIKPEISPEPQPTPKFEPIQPKPEPEPQITKKDKEIPVPLPQPEKPEEIPHLTPEEAEVVAQLDELEEMELISNYENLENLELALIGEGNESLQ